MQLPEKFWPSKQGLDELCLDGVLRSPNGDHPAGSGAWVQLPTDDPAEDHTRLARMCLDGEHWSTEGPSLSELLAVIDEARERLRQGTLSSDC